MLEVLRVLAGFESSWDWNAGVDTTNPTCVTPDTIEAGAWQVSANSTAFGEELKDLVLKKVPIRPTGFGPGAISTGSDRREESGITNGEAVPFGIEQPCNRRHVFRPAGVGAG
jgi:hypothetical protein